MKFFLDYNGTKIRLTDERLSHILEHPELVDMVESLEEILKGPEHVIISLTDPYAKLYYKYYDNTIVGEKYFCVVIKEPDDGDAFLLTAYLTDKIKKGDIIWPKK